MNEASPITLSNVGIAIEDAKEIGTPVERLREIYDFAVSCKDFDSFGLRNRLAKNLATPMDILVRLAGDENEFVRASVAENMNSTEEMLMDLADDGKYPVKVSLARNPRSPEAALLKLAGESHPTIREKLVENPMATKAVLERLAEGRKDKAALVAGLRLAAMN